MCIIVPTLTNLNQFDLLSFDICEMHKQTAKTKISNMPHKKLWFQHLTGSHRMLLVGTGYCYLVLSAPVSSQVELTPHRFS